MKEQELNHKIRNPSLGRGEGDTNDDNERRSQNDTS